MESLFNIKIENGTAKITLSGRLDTSNAGALSDELKTLIGQDIQKVVFFVNDLEYISSAGLRVIIFAKQKIGTDTRVYLVGANSTILDVVKMTGMDNFLFIQDTYQD